MRVVRIGFSAVGILVVILIGAHVQAAEDPTGTLSGRVVEADFLHKR